jgi:prepilin-type N-terminal cleavage/methylation domain-containing protein
MQRPHIHNPRSAGFTLIEIAMVILIMGLLLGGGLTVVTTQMEQQRIRDTRAALDAGLEAIIGYAAASNETNAPGTHAFLPCPDKTGGGGAGVANDGQEDRTVATGACVAPEGNLPWVTLGITATDGWGSRLRYRVTPAFSNQLTGIRLTNVGTSTITNRAGANVATTIPVVLLSHGPNRLGGRVAAGGGAVASPPATSAGELENTDADLTYISDVPFAATAPGGEFDDIVTWMSSAVLFNRMIQAGKLP